MKRISIFLIFIGFLNGCGPSADEHASLKNENESLRYKVAELNKEVKKLKEEVDDLKFGAERLFALGKKAYDEKKI